jgi:hypothetical protein
MLSWPALLLAPLVALGQLSIAYSLVTPACASQSRGGLHAVAVVSLILVLATVAMAWRGWRRHAGPGGSARGAAPSGESERGVSAAESDSAAKRPHFVALVALLVGSLSALVSIVLWLPIWFLSPCY